MIHSVPVSYVDEWHSVQNSFFQELRVTAPISILDSKDLFCDAVICYLRSDGYRNYSDDNHLSNFGAEKQWQMIIAAVSRSE